MILFRVSREAVKKEKAGMERTVGILLPSLSFIVGNVGRSRSLSPKMGCCNRPSVHSCCVL